MGLYGGRDGGGGGGECFAKQDICIIKESASFKSSSKDSNNVCFVQVGDL